MLLAFILLAFATPVNAAMNWQYNYKVWMPPVWIRLAHCEGGTRPWYSPPNNEPNWKHHSGRFQGALGFDQGSWDRFNTFGYPTEAYNATPWQQYKVGLAIHDYKNYKFSGWGCYNSSWVRTGVR